MERNLALKELVDITNNRLGYVPTTPTEFNELSRMIKIETGRTLSLSTIKRIWGYVRSEGFPSVTTLNTLARYNGYTDWDTFFGVNKPRASEDSDFLEDSIVNAEDLSEGDRLSLSWNIGKSCVMEYLGGMRFRIVESENIKLLPGDKITLHTVCKGHPIYVSDIERGEKIVPAYIGAKKGGLISYKVDKKG